MASAARKSCVRCNQTVHSPAKFLIECCKCQRAWHHPCHIPPVKEAELLIRIEADDKGRPHEGLGAWVCRRCSKKAASSVLIIEPAHDQVREPLPVVSPKPSHSQASVRHIGQDRVSRATPHIDLLDPPMSHKRSTKVATSRRQIRNAPIILNPVPVKHELPIQLKKHDTPPAASPETEQRTESRPTSALSETETEPLSIATSPPLSRTDSRSASLAVSRQGSLHPPADTAISASLAPSPASSSGPSTGADPGTVPPARESSPPRIPYVMKGKERMPDFRSLISGLRAAGKLQGPPPLEPEEAPSQSEEDMDMETDDEATPRRRAPTLPSSRDTHDIEDMYATPARESVRSRTRTDTHDIDDLYATPPPQSTRAASRYDTHDIDDMYATPAPEPLPRPSMPPRMREVAAPERPSRPLDNIELQLVFDWHDERYPEGKGDEWFSILTRKIEQMRRDKEGNGDRKARKPGPGATRQLSKKEKRKREAEALSFYVP